MEKLINFCKTMSISCIRIIVLGNSLSSGFSLSGKTIPLLYRDKELIES